MRYSLTHFDKLSIYYQDDVKKSSSSYHSNSLLSNSQNKSENAVIQNQLNSSQQSNVKKSLDKLIDIEPINKITETDEEQNTIELQRSILETLDEDFKNEVSQNSIQRSTYQSNIQALQQQEIYNHIFKYKNIIQDLQQKYDYEIFNISKQYINHKQQEVDLNIDLDNLSKFKTTICIQNIPNKYTHQTLLELINPHFAQLFDFFYLPLDHDNQCNIGYGFINLIDEYAVQKFYQKFQDFKWPKYNSEKICQLKYAKIQGKNEFNNSIKSKNYI